MNIPWHLLLMSVIVIKETWGEDRPGSTVCLNHKCRSPPKHSGTCAAGVVGVQRGAAMSLRQLGFVLHTSLASSLPWRLLTEQLIYEKSHPGVVNNENQRYDYKKRKQNVNKGNLNPLVSFVMHWYASEVWSCHLFNFCVSSRRLSSSLATFYFLCFSSMSVP